MTVVVGLNAYHADSSACIFVDGLLVAAAEEERFRRIKHWAGFPSRAIEYCLNEASVGLSDVDHVGLNSNPQANLGRKVLFTLRNRPDPRFVIERLRNARQRMSIADVFEKEFPASGFRAKIHGVEHHLSHLMSAFHLSPFPEATVLSVDGFGDFSSATWGFGRGDEVATEGRVYFPHSLGIFYQAVTQFLGFPNYGDEYKVMGLASYGEPHHMAAMGALVRSIDDGGFELGLDYFRHHRDKVPYRWNGGIPEVGTLYSDRIVELLGAPRRAGEELTDRHRDIARSAQAAYEDALVAMLTALHRRHGTDALALAGGCGMNSVANGRIRERTPYRRIYIQAAAGDAGGALGAALEICRRVDATPRGQMPHAYWGPGFDAQQADAALSQRARDLEAQRCEVTRVETDETLCKQVAGFLCEASVVGWFQGRMEWGPRALGNRSILCDPRRSDAKDLLNAKIKRRESFRPFAPSVLRESVHDWFETDDDVPFMMKVLSIRADRRESIPAVTHVDGTGRLQTVSESNNPLYHRLISEFADRTGVPMLLNTSFNENEPVVCTPAEALDCFLRTNMDVLVLGRTIVRRVAPD